MFAGVNTSVFPFQLNAPGTAGLIENAVSTEAWSIADLKVTFMLLERGTLTALFAGSVETIEGKTVTKAKL